MQKKYDSRRELDEYKSDEQKKAELLTAMVNKMGNYDEPLPQDLQEGVDEDEWVRMGRTCDPVFMLEMNKENCRSRDNSLNLEWWHV